MYKDIVRHKRWDIRLPQGIERVSFDHMPAEVATEMLCAPKARMTNRERKECTRARETRFSSTLERKPVAMRLLNTYFGSSLEQLGRWNRRAVKRGKDAQCQYQSLAKALDKLARGRTVEQYAALLAKRKQAELDVIAAHHARVAELTGSVIKLRTRSSEERIADLLLKGIN